MIGTAQVHATSGALTATNSGTFTVVPGAAASVAFTTQPSGGIANVAFSLRSMICGGRGQREPLTLAFTRG